MRLDVVESIKMPSSSGSIAAKCPPSKDLIYDARDEPFELIESR